jgi:uncharacterized tellurite resistance protein B-like protein
MDAANLKPGTKSMPFILMILGAVAGAAFWWWRFKAMGEAASEIHDAAGKVIGKYRRNKFRKKVEGSPLTAVDDPRAAAVIMMMAIVQEEGPLDEASEAAIRREVTETIGESDPTELMIFSKWAVSHTVDANDVSFAFRKLWADGLSAEQKQELVEMAVRAASAKGAPSQSQLAKIDKLSIRLGLKQG